ncbi:MAG: HEAT repeat domain-containing protein [Nitrospirae bacterium]|nr:HEAT repeat domain-containing protein [Nitrospirota bacterium]
MHTARLNKLLRDITDEDASKRRSAAEALSDGDERAVYPLIKALRDDNFGVQDAAMRSLMNIKGETTAYMVLPLLRENSFLRNTAILILREMGTITVPLLQILLNDRDDDVRKFALDLIHDIQQCSYPEKLVEMLTGDTNANVRAAAAKTIGRLQLKKALPQLTAALKDEEWVCFSALEALIDLKEEEAISSIVDLLNSPSETIRYAAIEALGKIGSHNAVQSISDHISRAEGFEKKAAIRSLVQIGTVPSMPGVSDALIDMLADDDWDEKFTAIKGLAALKDETAIYHMIDAAGSLDLSDPESEDKLTIIKEAIYGLGCTSSLIDLLNDASVKYRGKVAAIEIIGDLKCKNAVTILIDLLKSDYRDVRRSSIKSLSQIESDEAKNCLMEAIADPDSHVRKTAVSSLGKIGDMTAFEPLMKMLQNEKYNDVIDEFINALININPDLFLSRINELNDNIREMATKFTSELNSGYTC